MNSLSKLIFLFKKPKVVVVMSSNQEVAKKTIFQILGNSFRIKKEVLFVNNVEKAALLAKKYLVLNFDNNNIRKIKNKTSAKILTFGFQKRADFQATDIKENDGTNFKISHQGNIVPIWIEETFDQEKIYPVLAAIVVGTIFDLNLVEISQALRKCNKLIKNPS